MAVVKSSFDIDKVASYIVGQQAKEMYIEPEGGTIIIKFNDDSGLEITGIGDCCAHTYLNDIVGLDHLVSGGYIVSVEEYYKDGRETKYEVTDLLGFKFITDHPSFGEVTTVFAGRCVHNGYYSGRFVFEVHDNIEEVIADCVDRQDYTKIDMSQDTWQIDDNE